MTAEEEGRGLRAYILAGGKSRRFGGDKARAPVGGRPLIARLAETLSSAGLDVTAVADRPGRFADLGLRTIADPIPDLGPIGGILGALEDARRGPVFAIACDFVAFEPRWIGGLRRALRPADTAAAFRGAHWEPTFALWAAEAAPAVRAAIERGVRSLQSLLDELRARPVPLPSDWHRAVQVNTREELEAWLQRGGG